MKIDNVLIQTGDKTIFFAVGKFLRNSETLKDMPDREVVEIKVCGIFNKYVKIKISSGEVLRYFGFPFTFQTK